MCGDSFTFDRTIEHFNVTHGIGATYEDNLGKNGKENAIEILMHSIRQNLVSNKS